MCCQVIPGKSYVYLNYFSGHFGLIFRNPPQLLEQWIPSRRNRFTAADLDFLTSVLAAGEQRPHLEKLWGDPDTLWEMLDLKEVFRGLLDSPAAIRVSPRFYFYVLVRHAFLQADLSDSELADFHGEPALRMHGRRSARHRDAGPGLVDGAGDARLAAARLGGAGTHIGTIKHPAGRGDGNPGKQRK